MATIVQTPAARNNLGATPWGNRLALHFTLLALASGAIANSDSGAAPAIGDVIVLGQIPAGTTLTDSQVVVSTALTAAVTGALGFVYTDGVDDAKVPQDSAYFGSALSLAAAARLRNATTKVPVTLPKDANLVLTIGGAANAKAGRVDVLIEGIATGAL